MSGNVLATLEEPVEVEAGGDGLAVNVASLESRLDDLTAAVEASSPTPGGELVARSYRIITDSDQAGYLGLAAPAEVNGSVPAEGPPDVPSEVLVQSITINSVDDELDIRLWKDGEEVYVVANSFGDNLGRAHFTYPAPIEADVITFNCNNEIEQCDGTYSWAGRLAEDT